MNIKDINNKNAFSNDWAADDRRKMLRSIPAPKPLKHGWLAPGLSSRWLCGQDVSILDRRSVKAQLAGHGDYRATWWNLYSALYSRIFRSSTLEEAMYSFHKMHQTITLLRLETKSDFWAIYRAFRAGGAIAGIRCVIELERERRELASDNK